MSQPVTFADTGPSAAAYASPSDRDLEQAVGEITRHAAGYQKAYKYWRGTQHEVFASPNLKVALRQTGASEYGVSIGKRVVAAVTDRLEITSVDVDDATSETLNGVMKTNRMDIKQPDLFRRAVSLGDMYATVPSTAPGLVRSSGSSAVSVGSAEAVAAPAAICRWGASFANPKSRIFA